MKTWEPITADKKSIWISEINRNPCLPCSRVRLQLLVCKGHITRCNISCNLQDDVARRVTEGKCACDIRSLQLPAQKRRQWKLQVPSAVWVATCDVSTATCLAPLTTLRAKLQDCRIVWHGFFSKCADSQRRTHACALKNRVASCWRGVTLCKKRLRLLREVEPGFYFVQRCAQQNSHALQVAEVPCYTIQFFNNAMVFRCKLLEIARCDRTWTTFGEIMAIVLLSRKRCRAIAPQQQWNVSPATIYVDISQVQFNSRSISSHRNFVSWSTLRPWSKHTAGQRLGRFTWLPRHRVSDMGTYFPAENKLAMKNKLEMDTYLSGSEIAYFSVLLIWGATLSTGKRNVDEIRACCFIYVQAFSRATVTKETRSMTCVSTTKPRMSWSRMGWGIEPQSSASLLGRLRSSICVLNLDFRSRIKLAQPGLAEWFIKISDLRNCLNLEVQTSLSSCT